MPRPEASPPPARGRGRAPARAPDAAPRSACAEREQVAAAAATLGVALDAHQLDQLTAYLGLLQKWNRSINLTAVRDRSAMLTHHLIDCLAVVPALRRRGVPGTVLDVGSGAGLPGVVLAIALPGLAVTCIDAVAKKSAFIRHVAGELGLAALSAEHARAEAMAGRYELVVARAVGTLREFVELTRDRLAEGGAWLAMKGRRPDIELNALAGLPLVFHVEPLTVPGLDAARCLVWIEPHAQ